MPNYQQGKIYKIVSNTDDELCYVGSTTLPLLCQRMAEHRDNYKCLKSGGKVNHTSSYILLDKYGVENCRIELIEIFPCNSKDELTKKEGEYIRLLNCVNKNIAGRTKQEWREDNPEYSKKWREANRDTVAVCNKKWREANREYYNVNKDKWSEKYTCICGLTIRKYGKKRHEKSQKHINYCISVSVVL